MNDFKGFEDFGIFPRILCGNGGFIDIEGGMGALGTGGGGGGAPLHIEGGGGGGGAGGAHGWADGSWI